MTADVELCEWWPERDDHAVIGGGGCPNEATLSVGVTENWHLCGSCAALPRFKRFKRFGRIGSAR